MKGIPQKTRRLFEKWGRSGGLARARRLSSRERSLIAARAAGIRWKAPLRSIRIDETQMDEPVYLEEILSDGTWEDWRSLYRTIAEHPFGDTAKALETVCNHIEIYGSTALWRGILHSVQGGHEETKN